MPLTPEELLGQLKTRGFEDGFQRTPLREFTGILESITAEDVASNGRSWVNAIYNFTELEIIKSTEPYTLPIAQISIGISNRKQSAMGVFGASVDKLLNVDEEGNPLQAEVDGAPNPDIKGQGYLIGKRLHMTMTGGHMQWDRNKGTETPRENWEVMEVVGETAEVDSTPEPAPAAKKVAPKAATKGAKSSIQIALGILNGKTQQEWNQEVFKNATVKADGALIAKIIQGTLLKELTDAGQVTKAKDGKYTVDEALL